MKQDRVNAIALIMLLILLTIDSRLDYYKIKKLENKFNALVDIQHDQLKLQENMLDLIAPIQLTPPEDRVGNITVNKEDSLFWN